MPWNWELPEWPTFQFDPEAIAPLERQFLLQVGTASAYLKTIQEIDYQNLAVEILSIEGEESARIEGEVLDRKSLQSSIKRHFGIHDESQHIGEKEAGMAQLLCSVYETFHEPLSHEMLFKWHAMLFQGATHIENRGTYRSHPEPMQMISNRYGTVFFEAPPSARIKEEMTQFILWFNTSSQSLPLLIRAAIAHLYFECIHPFDDGNGRIGRVIAEKALSQGVERPILLALSKLLEARKKKYYAAFESCNHSLNAEKWTLFFADAIVTAHEEVMQLSFFLIEKSKLLLRLKGQLNPRQEKVLLRLFAEGPKGFKGGLSAENYLSITKTTRATATRDLTALVEMGALTKKGERRYTRYYLNIESL